MGPLAIDSSTLLDQLDDGLAEARRQGQSLVSVTTEVDPGIDPSSLAFGSRLAGDRWFCWEQPDRDGFALAGVGVAREIVSRGPERFRDVARGCADLSRATVNVAPVDLPSGAGPVFLGGFAFDAEGAREPHWSSLAPAHLVLPTLALWRRGGSAYTTVTAAVGADPEAALDAARARLAGLDARALPPPGLSSARSTTVRGSRDPSHYEGAVSAAVERIDAGEAEKIVLAREVLVEADSAQDPALVFGALRELFPSCFCFCCGTPEAAFLGASPELLVRRSGATAATVGLAGSTRRSADPSVDDHLGESLLRSAKDREEHEIVVRRIERELRGMSVWVDAGADPVIAKVANIQHLATPITAQLAEPRSAVELAGALHPTPAVGGEPREAALGAIAELEGMDRGWYAGPVGWMDAAEDGEFCVALRSALLRDRVAHLYAGAGIVADSDPGAELAETELKLEAMLPLLS
jgi:salicylate biosynthesis isochorismate synthase/menaquinone-specific isochorismate synthase